MSCGVCSQRIGSEIDGRFCEGCGNPVHNSCGPPAQPVSNDELLSVHQTPKCPRCGSDPNTPVAVQVRSVWLGYRAWKEVEDQAPLLETRAKLQRHLFGSRVCLVVSVFFLCLAVIFVALGGFRESPEGAITCVGAPGAFVVFYYVCFWSYRQTKRAVENKLDQVLEEKECARIERGEPPG
jgi:hypothetical protein